MRTQANTERRASKKDGQRQRPYTVHGTLIFKLRHQYVIPDLAVFFAEIYALDATHRWRHETPAVFRGLTQWQTGRHFVLSAAYEHMKDGRIERVFDCRWTPVELPPSRLYAYETYLRKMAKQLKERRLPDVVDVRSLITITRETTA